MPNLIKSKAITGLEKPPTNLELSARIERLKNSMVTIKNEFRQHSRNTLEKFTKNYSQQKTLVAEIAKFKDLRASYTKINNCGKTIKAFENDLGAIHSHCALMILKQAVVTEVTWMNQRFPGSTQNVSIRLIKAMENTDNWWNERKEWSIDKWITAAVHNDLQEV